MKLKNNKQLAEFVFLFGILIFSISLVNAISLSQDYFNGNPAKVGSGETKEVIFGRIISRSDEGDRKMILELIEGEDIAEIISEKSFTVLAGSRENEIKLRVSIPSNVPEGKTYSVSIRIKDVTPSKGEGMVTFTQSTTSSIPILVKKEEVVAQQPLTQTEKPLSSMIWAIAIVVVIAIAIVAYFLLPGKKNKEEKTKKRK